MVDSQESLLDDVELSEEELEAIARQMAKRSKGRRVQEDAVALNVNSMMDIMTILLVFLLVSVTSDPLAIKENNTMKLSRSSSNFPAVYSTPIIISKKEIVVDQKRALPVACKLNGRPCTDDDFEKQGAQFYVDPVNKEHGKRESLLIVPLKKSLEISVKRMKDQNLDLPEEVRKKYMANQGVATLICDRDIPFRMIAEIVYTTAMVELHDIRFAIVYSDNR
jgi:biopolymer transport protein ExbD